MKTEIILLAFVGLFGVWRLCICLFKEDKPAKTFQPKLPVPPAHAPQFKTRFQSAAEKEAEKDYRFRDFPGNPAEIKHGIKAKPTPFQTETQKAIESELNASRNHTINHFKSGAKPHPEPKKR